MQALIAQAQVESMLDFVPSTILSRRASKLSLELDHATGDCFFLAIAEVAAASIITADAKFVASCAGTRYEALVTLLD